MKAYQRIVRENREEIGCDEGLFGKWWESLDRSINNAVVRPIDYNTARKLIEQYEWLGCMPAVCWYQFGIFFDGSLAGAVVYGPEYSENLGVLSRNKGIPCADWSKYGFEGRMILLSRGACTHWAHPHSGSKLIRESMRQLPHKFTVITATVDDLAGEVGTIYQACGFHFVGSMRDSNPNVTSKKGDRYGWVVGEKLYGSRYMRQICGTTKYSVIKQYFPNVRKVRQNSKGRYFAFRGSKAIQKQHYRAIQHLIKPYPKRESTRECAVTNTEAEVSSQFPLQ